MLLAPVKDLTQGAQPTYTGNSHAHMLTTLPPAVTVTTLQLL